MARTKKPRRLKPVATHHDIDSGSYSVEVEFEKIDGTRDRTLLPRHSNIDTRPAARLLAERGAVTPPNGWANEIRAALNAPLNNLVTTTRTLGWIDAHTFLLPDGPVGRDQLVRSSSSAQPRQFTAGSLKKWKRGLKAPCAKSRILTVALAAGMAGPLLRPLREPEGVVFHLFGKSSTGKSLSLIAAQSVIGPATRNELPTFDSTDRAVEEQGARSNDSLLLLDEAGRMNRTPLQRRRQLAHIAYSLSSGNGRRRSAVATSNTNLRNVEFLVVGLSSGEEPLDSPRGAQRNDGEKVRLIGIPVPSREDGGIFELESTQAIRDQLADQAEITVRENYGLVIRRFVQLFLEHDDGPNAASTYQNRFLSRVLRTESPFARRFARKFAIVYAAAMLAVDFKIAPWNKKKAYSAIKKVYLSAWNEVCSDGDVADEFINWLRINAGNSEKFPEVAERSKAPEDASLLGIRRQIGGKNVLAMLPSCFEKQVTRTRRTAVRRILKEKGILLPGDEENKFGRLIRVKGLKKARTRFLCFDLSQLAL